MTDAERQELEEMVGEQLRAKITSKFQTSTFLAGLAGVALGAQLSDLSGGARPPLFALSIALMFGAVLIYVAALIKLDELTMPKRFWKADPQRHAQDYEFVQLEDRDLEELRKGMVFFWYTLTLVATAFTGVALLMLLVPSNWAPAAGLAGSEATFITVLAVIALTGAYFLILAAVTLGRPQALHRLSDWLRRWKFDPLMRMKISRRARFCGRRMGGAGASVNAIDTTMCGMPFAKTRPFEMP